MSARRAPRRLLSFVLPIAAAAACAMAMPPSALAGDRAAAQDTIREATEIAATVVYADGAPVEGAVVVTSAGGKGVSGHDGRVRLSLAPDASLTGAQVTAVATVDGVNHVGSVQLDLTPQQVAADAGVIVLSAEGECEPAWLPTFGSTSELNGAVHSLAVFDDDSGDGPALFVGGEFTLVGGKIINRIAKWDGDTWSSLGDGMNSTVRALTVFDDGAGPALYAGGSFSVVDDQGISRIAKWDGASWSSLGSGASDTVYALTVFDDGAGPALYAGGEFILAGGLEVNRIAKWDGAAWSPLGSGVGGLFGYSVYALTVFDDGSGPALYIGGLFTTVGGETANRIAKWDGQTWSPLGEGLNDWVEALAVFDDGSGPALYAGGNFTMADGETANGIAKWDGQNWSPLGSGVSGSVWDLTVFDDGSGSGPALYAGGWFNTTADGASANFIARWDGQNWSPLSSGLSGGGVIALTVFDDGTGPALYAGGAFSTAGDVTAHRIANWKFESWSSVGTDLNNSVTALKVFDDGSGPALYVGGYFAAAKGVKVNHIAKWDGVSWSPVGGGMNGTVWALAISDNGSGAGSALYAGGEFTTAGGVTVNHIAKWDGAAWSSLGNGMNNTVFALSVHDDGSGAGAALYAGGVFTMADDVTANQIAKWDGAAWSPLGEGMSGGFGPSVTSLAVFDDGAGGGPALYAGGDFTTAGGVTVNSIAKWDGVAWSHLNNGMGGVSFPIVRTLTVFDDGSGAGPALYAGGNFFTAGGEDAVRIARWDGAAWSNLGNWISGSVYDLTVFDDGSGPALYAGGAFTVAGNVPANHIAKWDGEAWSPMSAEGISQPSGGGMNDWVTALTVYDDGSGAGPALYAGGFFTDSPARDAYLARLQGCPVDATIPGDLNGDGVVNAQDLGILLGSWGPCPPEPDPCPADINGDGVVNAQDLGNLLGAWGATASE